MKTESGFTLIELMIVIAIVSIVAAGALFFPPLLEKRTVESYAKEIQALLIRARNDASTINSPSTVTLAANQIQVSQNINGVVKTSLKNYPKYTINFTANPIVFDRRGLTTNIQTISLTGYNAGSAPEMDCVVIAFTRINVGRMNGVNCVQY